MYNTEDLYALEVLNDIMNKYKSNFVLGGKYKIENKTLKVTIDIFGKQKKITIKREYEAGITAGIRHALGEVVIKTTKSFSSYNPDTANLTAYTDYPCTLYVNGVVSGTTPGRFLLPAGSYTIEIVYENDVFKKAVLEKHVTLKKGMVYDLGKIQVLAALTVKSNVEAEVFCDGVKIGVTDLIYKIPVGNAYIIDIVYTDEYNEKRKKREIITTYAGKNIVAEIIFPCRIIMKSGNLAFSGILEGITRPEHLPITFDALEPGKYQVKIVKEDPEWKRDWVILDKKVTLYNAQTAIIDKSDFVYKKYRGLCFIPGAAQLYNLQKKKGYILMGFAIGAIVESVIVGYFRFTHYNNEYLSAKNNIKEDLNVINFSQITNTQNILTTAMWSGIILFSGIFMYSCIDGIITMEHLYDLFYLN